jgi:protein-tyrosine kinase
MSYQPLTRNKTLEKNLDQTLLFRCLSHQKVAAFTEMKTDPPSREPEIPKALGRHESFVGHVLNSNSEMDAKDTGPRVLNEKELLQQLRGHGVIFSGDRLTSKGLRLSIAWLGVMNQPQAMSEAVEKAPEQNILSPAVTGNRTEPHDRLETGPVAPGPGDTVAIEPEERPVWRADENQVQKKETREDVAPSNPPALMETSNDSETIETDLPVQAAENSNVLQQQENTISQAPENPVQEERAHENDPSSDPPVLTEAHTPPPTKSDGLKDDHVYVPDVSDANRLDNAGAFDESLVTLLSPQGFEAEHFRMLKTRILYPVSGSPPRSLLITSVGQSDGKSFVAANLAISIAQNLSNPVLLIDCDLRKPSIHRLFGLGNVPGLSEYLRKTRNFQSLLQKTDVDRLYLLPAGSTPNNPSELLASERMVSLIKELMLRYRDLFILLDSPPVTVTAEPSVLARLASKVLLVIKYGKTRRSELQMVMDKLGKEKFLGGVINCYEHSLREYYEYRKYPGYGSTANAGTVPAFANRTASN